MNEGRRWIPFWFCIFTSLSQESLLLVMIQVSLQNKDKTNGYIFPSTDSSYCKCSAWLGAECKTNLKSCLYIGVVDFTSLNTGKIVIWDDIIYKKQNTDIYYAAKYKKTLIK